MHTGYNLEPKGTDAASEICKVERLNGTFESICGFIAGFPAQSWSDTLVHAEYLKNCHWHSALGCQPMNMECKCPRCLSILH